MSLLVTGSIGIDTVETPFGKRDDVIGGSAIYFSYASSFFTPVRLVGVVGEDCPKMFFDVFKDRDVDTSGLEIADNLGNDIFIAGFLQISDDHRARVSFGVCARFSEPLRGP